MSYDNSQTNSIVEPKTLSYSTISQINTEVPNYKPVIFSFSCVFILVLIICATCIYLYTKRLKLDEKHLDIRKQELELEKIKLKMI